MSDRAKITTMQRSRKQRRHESLGHPGQLLHRQVLGSGAGRQEIKSRHWPCAIEDADRERIGLREWLNGKINGKACVVYLASTIRDHPPRTRAANSGATLDKRMRGILISLVRNP